jgi:hypothetical protein
MENNNLKLKIIKIDREAISIFSFLVLNFKFLL